MQLTPHQQEKFQEVIELIRKKNKRIIIKGSAGVGKTVLVSELVKFFKRDYTLNPDYNNGAVYVTAPTNKALAVLTSKIDTPVEFKTIHSALKMKMVTNGRSGQRKFVKTWGGKKTGTDFDQCKICCIDEASMLNSDFIGGNENTDFKGYLDSYSFPIIFIGDHKQLNPVGEEISPVWTQGFPEVELTEIIRQGEGNPIIELSRDLDMIYFKIPKLIDGKGYLYSNARESLVDNLAEVNGTDDLKYLAYTNDKGPGNVDDMNRDVRIRRYKNPARVEKEETLVFNTPMGTFYTNKEVKVESLEIITNNVVVPKYKTRFDEGEPTGDIDHIKMKYYRVNDAFNIVHEHSDAVFKNISLTLKENCNRHGWNWNGYYFFIEQFADIKYNHAITVHKSQGSTYKEAIINIGNMDFNSNSEEKQRLLYTAVTRASNLVILNNVK